MLNVIQDLWVITEGGITVFQKIHNTQVGDQLFGMLMSALDSFAHEMSENGLTGFKMNRLHFNLLRKNGLIFVASSSIKINQKKIIGELKFVMNQFFENYPEEKFIDWNGDINIFTDFEQIICKPKQEYIGDYISKLWGE